MEYEEFKKILKDNKLTMRKFANLSNISYSTCSGWGEDDRKVSDWVKPFLTLYSENQRLKVLEDKVKSMCDEANNK
jgi:DNA-binding transcriptional regulator YiaG